VSPYLADRSFIFGIFHPHWRTPIDFVSDEMFDLGAGVSLTWVPDWMKDRETTRRLGWEDRRLMRRAKLMLQYEIPIFGDAREMLSGLYGASTALWLARPTHVTLLTAFHAGHDDDHPDPHGWIPHCWQHVERVRPSPVYHKRTMRRRDLERAKRLHLAIMSTSLGPDVATALSSLWTALTARWIEGRHISLWIALEALFGSSSVGETTYRLAHRLALFLGGDASNCRSLYRDAVDSYRLRSQLVHGHRLTKQELTPHHALLWKTERMLRDALVGILESAALMDAFKGRNREPFLDDLVFRGRPARTADASG
jgi:hypothetical protein